MDDIDVERNKLVIRRFLEAVVNTGETDLLSELVSPACEETDGRVRVHRGVEGMAEHVRAVRQVYADLHLTITRQIAEGEWVATQFMARGTHAREWLGVPASGMVMTFFGVNIDRIVDGKIVEHGGSADMLGPYFEAGLLKPTAP